MELTRQPLCPDEIQRAVITRRLGRKIHYHEMIPSTNLEAHRLALQGAAEGEIIIAEGQTRGRGRMKREWWSPPYLNLYISIILRPNLSPEHASKISLMSAVALAETVQSFLSYPPEIKWPNDILVGGKKLAGILTESSCEPGRLHFVILGIGVNLNVSRDLMPSSIQNLATSLMMLTHKPVDRSEFARRLIQNLDQCYGNLENGDFAHIARRWESFFSLKGQRVRVEMSDQQVFGKAIGIDGDGALILENGRGCRNKIVAGDVIPLET
jgi:BirA family biotin operon repressor/biotin-[acetyl-CoA-carboxylase] ligase